MDPYDLSIRLKTLDGQWEEVGAEAVRYRGVWPENVSYSHNDWGDDTCSFDLRRDPGAIHPDLSAFTDCDITVCGRLAWAGRVKETPTREGADPVINVQGEGLQYHMDDDQYERVYVHTRLSEWRDLRSFLLADLTKCYQAGTVATDNGAVSIGMPRGSTMPTGGIVGVQLDLGQDEGSWPRRVVLEWEGSNNDGNIFLVSRCTPTEEPVAAGAGANVIVFANTVGASGTTAGTVPVLGRYLSMFLLNNTGIAYTPAADVWLKLKAVRVFSDAAYESGNESILSADIIATDALDSATLLLDPDRTGIEPGVFDEIPEFATAQLVSPREAWSAANAYENYETKIDARRPIFRPRASTPIYEIGEWSGAEFEDASANSGAEILNRVFVEGQTAAGERLVVERWSQGDVDYGITQPSNPSADTNTTGWAATFGTITRDTVVFDSTPGSFLLTTSGVPVLATAAITTAAVLTKGRRYAVTVMIRHRAAANEFAVRVLNGTTLVDEYRERRNSGIPVMFPGGPDDTWRLVTVDWVQPADAAAYTIEFFANSTAGAPVLNFDTIQVARSAATLVDRRGFAKSRTLPISNRITQASGERLGTLYLDQHTTTPFTGGFKAVGVGGVRRILGGQAVHPGWLGRDTGQLVRANHVIDPDTGGVGRDERIKTVSYDHNTLTATVSLAEDRSGFDALLAQLAVVVGS